MVLSIVYHTVSVVNNKSKICDKSNENKATIASLQYGVQIHTNPCTLSMRN